MSTIDGNSNPQRLGRPTGPIKPRTPTLEAPPQEPRVAQGTPKPQTDRLNIATRPTSDQDRLKAAVSAAQAAGTGKPKAKEEEPAVAKTVADAMGIADGTKEGIKIASSVDELEKLPVVGRLMQGGGRLERIGGALARSQVGSAIAHAMEHGRYVAPLAKGLGRAAPIAGAVVGGFDIADAVKTNNDPKATRTERVLANVKAGLSTVSAAAGVAALFLAPTGIGGAIAGGISLATGLLSTGADFALGKVRSDRKKAEAQ
jgi:hypothetical protein